MKTYNNIKALIAIVAIVIISAAFNASAETRQQQPLAPQQRDSLYILNARAIQASISDKANKNFHAYTKGVKNNNKIRVENRRGWLLGAEGGYTLGQGFIAGIKAGYRGVGVQCFTPEIAGTIGQAVVEGKSYTTYGLQLRANFEVGSEKIKLFAGPTLGYKFFTVDTGVVIDGETRAHNQQSNALTIGVNAGIKIKIGELKRGITVPLYNEYGERKPVKAYTISNPIHLVLTGDGQKWEVEKPNHSLVKKLDISVKAGIEFLF